MVLHLCAVYVLGFEPFSFVLLENKTKQSAMFFWATLTIYMRDQWNKIHKQTKFRNRKKQSLRNRIEGTHKKGGNGNLYYAFPSHVKWISHNFHDSMEEACMQDKKKSRLNEFGLMENCSLFFHSRSRCGIFNEIECTWFERCANFWTSEAILHDNIPRRLRTECVHKVSLAIKWRGWNSWILTHFL